MPPIRLLRRTFLKGSVLSLLGVLLPRSSMLMPSLVVTPNPAAPSTVVSVAGSGFPNAKTRLVLDGQGAGSNIFRPRKDGTFNVGITVSGTAKTQTLVAQQLSGSTTWTDKASVSVVVAVPAPTPVPTPVPIPTPTPTPVPATDVTFFDDFTSPVWSVDRYIPDPKKWTLNTEWPTTGLSKASTNDTAMVSVVNNELQLRCELRPGETLWRSAVTDTKGLFSQMYGLFEARMWYTKGQGGWPAFWLLDATSEGRRSELDIIEAYPFGSLVAPFPSGGGPAQYAMTSHLKRPDGTFAAASTWAKPGYDLTTGWHVFGMEWRKDLLVALCDGKEMGRQTANVPAVPMFIILDNVIGSWAGMPDATTPNPYTLRADWVKASR